MAEETTTSPPPFTGPMLGLVTVGISLAAFMNVLDSTIAVVALPSMSGSLAATPSQGSWVLTIYSVCLAVSLPLSGWLAQQFGQVRSFLWAVVLFTICSWLCASATNFNEMLVYRALQGLSGGVLLPFSQSLLLRIYPPEKHGLALGFWGLSAAVAPVMGPVLGGVITDSLGWPWIFYINLPIGGVCVAITYFMLKDRESPTLKRPVDSVGLLSLVLGVVCVQLALDRGHELDWLASSVVRGLFALGACSIVFFLIWERDQAHPIVDLSLFSYRDFSLGAVMTGLFYGVFIVVAVIYPLWMQTTLGYTPSAAGWVMATTSLFPLVTMGLIGNWLRAQNLQWTVMLGLCTMAVVILAHGLMTIQVSSQYLTTIRFLVGAAMPFLWVPLQMITLGSIPMEKMASATGLSNFVRMLSSSLATAMGITLWDERAIVHRADLVENLSMSDFQGAMATTSVAHGGLNTPENLEVLELLVSQQARTMAQQDVYIVGATILLSMVLLVGFLPKNVSRGAT